MSSPSVATRLRFGWLEGAFSVDDLELLHYYQTSTCFTFATEPPVRDFWRLAAPQIGFAAPHVLRGILSVTALHLSRYKKEREEFFLKQAFLHHDAALEMALPIFADVSTDNFEHISVFSTLLRFFALARPKRDFDLLLANEQSVPEWLNLFRSLYQLVSQKRDWLQLSAIATIFDDEVQPADFWKSGRRDRNALDELETNICNSTGKDINSLTAVLDALHHLRQIFFLFDDSTLPGQNQVGRIFSWLCNISDTFIGLVAVGNSEALCVLSFYCVLLRRLESFWWIEGWGLHLIECIFRRLPERYRLWVRWPIREIGWVP